MHASGHTTPQEQHPTQFSISLASAKKYPNLFISFSDKDITFFGQAFTHNAHPLHLSVSIDIEPLTLFIFQFFVFLFICHPPR